MIRQKRLDEEERLFMQKTKKYIIDLCCSKSKCSLTYTRHIVLEYSSYVCFFVLCFCFLFCLFCDFLSFFYRFAYCFSFRVVSFLLLYQSTDHCRRLENPIAVNK